MCLNNQVLKLSDSNIHIELNKNNRLQESVMFTSLKSIVDYYKDSYSYKNKPLNKFIQTENKINKNDLSIYEDKIQSILENSFYKSDIRYTGNNEVKYLINNHVGWDRVNDKGKFIKRLKKFLHSRDSLLVNRNIYYEKCLFEESDYIKFNIPEIYIQKINEVINAKIDSNNQIIFDISNEDYQPGLYNESYSSCWWDSYNEGRLHFINDEGFSIRRYTSNGVNFYPMGRVWGYIDYIRDSEVLVIFNLYDDDCNQINKYADFIIKALISLTNKEYFKKEIRLDSPYDDDNNQILWINGNRGVIISRLENKSNLDCKDYIDFKDSIFSDFENNNYYSCDNCGCRIDEDESYYCEETYQTLCEDCYNSTHDTCCECGDSYHTNNLTQVGDSYRMVCNRCIDNYCECCQCGELTHLDDSIYDDISGEYYCEYCHNQNFSTCFNCDKSINNDDLIQVEISCGKFESYCEDCINDDDNINKCSDCRDYKDTFQLSKIDDKFYCVKCEIRIGLQVK